jgi:hypothetical protein
MKQMHMIKHNVSSFPTLATVERDRRYKWLLPLCNWVGLTMNDEQQPRGWSFNPATVVLGLVVLGMTAIGFYWMGQRDSETRQLLERLDKIQKTAEQAKELSIIANGGHEKPPQEEKKK